MGRSNAPFRRLNQGRESFDISRGTAGYTSTGSTGIDGGVAVTTVYDTTVPGDWQDVDAHGKTVGAILIDNPNGRSVNAITISDNLVTFTTDAATAGDTLTFWVF